MMKSVVLFLLINSVSHGIIDWFIWKGYKRLVGRREVKSMTSNDVTVEDFKYWEDSKFYSTIGLDQLLHTAVIVSLYFWLFA